MKRREACRGATAEDWLGGVFLAVVFVELVLLWGMS